MGAWRAGRAVRTPSLIDDAWFSTEAGPKPASRMNGRPSVREVKLRHALWLQQAARLPRARRTQSAFVEALSSIRRVSFAKHASRLQSSGTSENLAFAGFPQQKTATLVMKDQVLERPACKPRPASAQTGCRSLRTRPDGPRGVRQQLLPGPATIRESPFMKAGDSREIQREAISIASVGSSFSPALGRDSGHQIVRHALPPSLLAGRQSCRSLICARPLRAELPDPGHAFPDRARDGMTIEPTWGRANDPTAACRPRDRRGAHTLPRQPCGRSACLASTGRLYHAAGANQR